MISDEQIKNISKYLVKRGYKKNHTGNFIKDDIEVEINDCDSVIQLRWYFNKHGIKRKDISVDDNDYMGLEQLGYNDIVDLDETFIKFEMEVEITKHIISELNKMNVIYEAYSHIIKVGNIDIEIYCHMGDLKFPIELKVSLGVTSQHPTLSNTRINQIQTITCECNMKDFNSKFKSFYEIYK